MMEKLFQIIIDLTKAILYSDKKGKENIFDDGIPFIRKFILNLSQEELDKHSKKKINELIDNIIKIMRNIMEEQLVVALNFFKDKYYNDYKNSFKPLLNIKYKEKKNTSLKENDFYNNCLDFIIEPIIDNIEKYGLLFLYNYTKNYIIKFCFKNMRLC